MILNRQRRVRVAVPALGAFLERVRKTLGLRQQELTVCLVSDAEIARLNAKFREKRGPTDVLSFPASRRQRKQMRQRRQRNAPAHAGRARDLSSASAASFASSASYLGDVAISPETARRNASRFGRTFAEEMRILVLHGVLHLLGYDHENDRGQMNRLERRLRRELGIG